MDVHKTELRDVATAGESAARQIGALRPGEDLLTGTAGIPGAPVIASMQQIAQRWEDAIRSWQRRAERHSESLVASAASYHQVDDTSTHRLNSISRAL